eukprot:4717163-Pyramimonas_sp.AAC.1
MAFSRRFRRLRGTPDPEVQRRSWELWRRTRCRTACFARSQAFSDNQNRNVESLTEVGKRML